MGLIVLLWSLLSTRRHFGFATETDTLSSFIPDAQDFLAGGGMDLFMHPPGYPILLALTYLITQDWLTAGLALSFAAAVITALVSFSLFRHMLSLPAAWGSLLALAASPAFLAYGAFATSDMVFLALFWGTLLLAYRADWNDSMVLWFLAGTCMGVALLTRTNAITLLPLAFVPLLAHRLWLSRRLMGGAAMVAGLLAPIALWIKYALFSGSTVMPSGGAAVNLAITYFAPEDTRSWGDAKEWAETSFDGIFSVLLHDPPAMAFSYAIDLFFRAKATFSPDVLIAYPLVLFVLPSVLLLLLLSRNKWVYIISGLLVLQYLLINLLFREARFSVYLVPFFGAACGFFFAHLLSLSKRRLPAYAASTLLALLVIPLVAVSLAWSLHNANQEVQRDEAEVASAVSTVASILSEDDVIVSRKPVLSFYSGAQEKRFPMTDSLDGLLEAITARKQSASGSVYIYYGSIEKSLRPELEILTEPEDVTATTDSLRLVDKGPDDDPWWLYEYRSQSTRETSDTTVPDDSETDEARATGSP